MRAPAEQGDLRDHAAALGDTRKDDVAILGLDMSLQRTGRFLPPHPHGFRYHRQGVDDLRISGHRIEMEIGAAGITAGLRELPCGEALVQPGDEKQRDAAHHDDDAQMRMHQVDDDDEQRHQWRIEEGDQRAGGDEGTQLLQILQRLVILAVAVQRGARRRRQNRCAELNLQFYCRAHQDEAAHRIHERLQQDSADDGDRQHDQRVHRAAGQHTVGNLEQIDRDRQQQHVDGDGEDHHHRHVAANGGHRLLQAAGEVDRFATLVEALLVRIAAATAATAGIGRAAIAAAACRGATFIGAHGPVVAVDGLDEGQVLLRNGLDAGGRIGGRSRRFTRRCGIGRRDRRFGNGFRNRYQGSGCLDRRLGKPGSAFQCG